MADVHELGPAAHLSAEAIGEPGQRRFRLKVVGESGASAAIWLEKEQLAALGEAIQGVLRDEQFAYEPPPLDDIEPDPVFPLNPDIDFKAAQLALGMERETQTIVVTAAPLSEEPDAEAVSFAFGFTRGHELQQEIEQVVAAGRKPCPLCGAPMNPTGHVCAKLNGHNPH